MERIALVIAPHADDAEIAMGGTIAAMVSQGVRVVVVDLSDGEPTPHGSPAVRKTEAATASRILGISERRCLGLKNREIFDTVENRCVVASVIREIQPTILFGPYGEDVHPDHVQAAQLVEAARFYSKFVKSDMDFEPWYPRKHLHFFSTHLKVRFNPSFIYDISPYIDKKMESVTAYHSQFVANISNAKRLDEIRNEAIYWGNQIGVLAGEPFLCREPIRVVKSETLFEV